MTRTRCWIEGTIAVGFVGLTFIEQILCSTSELLQHLLVCIALGRIFALEVGEKRKLQIWLHCLSFGVQNQTQVGGEMLVAGSSWGENCSP